MLIHLVHRCFLTHWKYDFIFGQVAQTITYVTSIAILRVVDVQTKSMIRFQRHFQIRWRLLLGRLGLFCVTTFRGRHFPPELGHGCILATKHSQRYLPKNSHNYLKADYKCQSNQADNA